MASGEMPFIKNLASSDRKIRTSALASLRTFLGAQSSTTLAPLEVLKLWKGLYVALWMCDRPVPQQNLAAELAALLEVLPRAAAAPWLRGFWATMAREWTVGIDVHRMNKFLLLVRRVVESSFRWMRATDAAEAGAGAKANWDAQRVDVILDLLREWPFSPDDEVPRDSAGDPYTIPAGLRIHVLDIWVDEADKAGLLVGEAEDAEAGKIVARIQAMVDELEQKTRSTAVRMRAKESLADGRLTGEEEKEEGEDGGGEENGSWDGFED